MMGKMIKYRPVSHRFCIESSCFSFSQHIWYITSNFTPPLTVYLRLLTDMIKVWFSEWWNHIHINPSSCTVFSKLLFVPLHMRQWQPMQLHLTNPQRISISNAWKWCWWCELISMISGHPRSLILIKIISSDSHNKQNLGHIFRISSQSRLAKRCATILITTSIN